MEVKPHPVQGAAEHPLLLPSRPSFRQPCEGLLVKDVLLTALCQLLASPSLVPPVVCSTCGSRRMLLRDLPCVLDVSCVVEEEARNTSRCTSGHEPSATLHWCERCGYNYLSVTYPGRRGTTHVLYHHLLDAEINLQRITHLTDPYAGAEEPPSAEKPPAWEYYIDNRRASRDDWMQVLASYRRTLRRAAAGNDRLPAGRTAERND